MANLLISATRNDERFAFGFNRTMKSPPFGLVAFAEEMKGDEEVTTRSNVKAITKKRTETFDDSDFRFTLNSSARIGYVLLL